MADRPCPQAVTSIHARFASSNRPAMLHYRRMVHSAAWMPVAHKHSPLSRRTSTHCLAPAIRQEVFTPVQAATIYNLLAPCRTMPEMRRVAHRSPSFTQTAREDNHDH